MRLSLLGSGVGVLPSGEAKVTSQPAERNLDSGFASSIRKKPALWSVVVFPHSDVLRRGIVDASDMIIRIFLGGIVDKLG